MQSIIVHNANVHNLDHVQVSIPRDSLVVLTGVSGSGKSSLAFDTIFVEGQRRYVESLSSYARQFIEQFEKPDVESIEGLSPAISIDQKSASRSPRSTVGTVTEIYDFLRVLYSRIGVPHCPQCRKEILPQTLENIVEQVWKLSEGSRLQILSPVVRGRKGDYNALFNQLRKEGYVRVRVDGETFLLEELPEDHRLERMKSHHIEVVIDRLVLKQDDTIRVRLTEAVDSALKKSDGYVIIQEMGADGDKDTERFFSRHLACASCDIDLGSFGLDEMAPRMFSFNSPYGACPGCEGLGFQYEISENMLVPDPEKTLMEGAIAPFERSTGRYYQAFLKKLAKKYGIRISTSFEQLSAEERALLFYGDRPQAGKVELSEKEQEKILLSEEEEDYDWFDFVSDFDGIINTLRRRYQYGTDATKNYIKTFMQEVTCTDCKGARLKQLSLSVTMGDRNIHDFCNLSIGDAHRFVSELPGQLNEFQITVGRQALLEVENRLKFLLDVGLEYLTMARRTSTLSGGEAQRIRLASQIGAGLSGILYILDEPSIGLHQHNNRQLIETLQRLRDQGNSLIVVEHDEDTIRAADWVIDIGPGPGVLGGQVVVEGLPSAIEKNPQSVTGQFLSGKRKIPIRKNYRKGTGEKLTIKGITCHNLKNVTAEFPLGKLICVSGLSGSGKSTLVFDVLYNALHCHFGKHIARLEGYGKVSGLEHLDKFIDIDQSPIGRSPRSNPATYTGIFDDIRKVFANTEDAKIRGFGPGHFSFNVRSGRCETCKGDGVITQEMHFLPDVHTTCEVCEGKRYRADTLEVQYHGKNIADVLAMTVTEACDFFESQPKIFRYLDTLRDVGLGYMELGQSATTLSGGEAQRVKLATEFCKRSTGRTLYLMDEPSVGLHWQDLEKLIEILDRLVDQGNTVVVIEHHLDFIKTADHVIDLGPESGERGGEIIATGTPHEVAKSKDSYTARYLREIF